MSEPKCVCSMGYENSCRVHNEKSKAAYGWANDYFLTNEETLGLQLFHREMLEVAHKAGQSDYDELTRQNKILRDALEYVLEDHDCEHIDCIEFNKQRAREALKSCGGGES